MKKSLLCYVFEGFPISLADLQRAADSSAFTIFFLLWQAAEPAYWAQ